MSDYLKKRMEMKMYGKTAEPKKKYVIPKKSAKKIKEEAEERERLGGDDTDLQKFFRSAMKKMTGHCLSCHARTETHVYQYAIYSICHILDKRKTKCPSVATNPGNWIELCPDCHTKFDSMNWDEREKQGYWDVVKGKLIHLWQDLAKEERRHFPEKLRIWMAQNDNFATEGEYDI